MGKLTSMTNGAELAAMLRRATGRATLTDKVLRVLRRVHDLDAVEDTLLDELSGDPQLHTAAMAAIGIIRGGDNEA